MLVYGVRIMPFESDCKYMKLYCDFLWLYHALHLKLLMIKLIVSHNCPGLKIDF